jgi:CheY-like chemotaxis protein
LIVDDLKINRNLARVMLERNNFEILEAENGQQAVEHFNGEELDVVLMDICMPVMDGIEAMEKIRAMTKNENGIPIIAFTSGEHKNSKSELLERGFSEYIKKPFKEEDLFDKISKFFPIRQSFRKDLTSKKPAL